LYLGFIFAIGLAIGALVRASPVDAHACPSRDAVTAARERAKSIDLGAGVPAASQSYLPNSPANEPDAVKRLCFGVRD
jgi:hypothetical protein